MTNTIKVIDLLNKIANGEELPKKILILDEVYYLITDEDGDIVYSQLKDRRNWEAFIDHKLNITRCLHEDVIILDEVEIIEEQEEIDFHELYESIKNIKGWKVPTKIKMKQDYYDRLATDVQKEVNMVETRDINMQPLNALYGLKVEIDDDINKDWEVVYE